MKKILLALMLLMGVHGFSQNVVSVFILVVDTNWAPVPNQPITGNYQGPNGNVSVSAVTDMNGMYWDSVLIAPQSTMVYYTIGGGCADSSVFLANPSSTSFADTLMICGGGSGPGGCDASFTSQVNGNTAAVMPTSISGQFNLTLDWGDGQVDNYTPANLPSLPFTHTYASPGVYAVCFTHANSSLGCSNTSCDSVAINGPGCQALWVLDSINSINTAGSVVLWNLSTGGSASAPLNYTWDWGDGTTSPGQYPMHTYADTGIYNICLTINDPVSGCTDTFCDSLGFDASGNLIYKGTVFAGFTVEVIDPATVGGPGLEFSAKVDVYPVPSKGLINIESTTEVLRMVEVFDISGARIGSYELNASDSQPARITIEHQGVYLLRIHTESGLVTKRVLVD